MDIFEQLPGALLPWYDENKRDLPWRHTRDAYPIWLSEIMLQQTRVEAVKLYYHRFLQELPTIEALAQCDDDWLYKLWEGLGYYSRVRNLRKAAQVIQERHGGVFPGEYQQVLALPGIGPYTAGAICSIAFEQKVPAVDGNVLRLVARLTDDASPIDGPSFKADSARRLQAVYPDRAGDFTQSLIELGATLCGPNQAPRCGECPCSAFCLGYIRGTAAGLPVKQPKKDKKVEEKTVFILSSQGKFALRKRGSRGLLAGLWEFPNVPGKLTTDQLLAEVEAMGLHPQELLRQVNRSHIFTHIRWDMQGVYLEVKEPEGGFVWLSAEEIERGAALPTAFRQFWEEVSRV